MTEYYTKLTVTRLEPEESEKTCGPYKYLVHNHWASHTAFVTRAGLDLWLKERGLSIYGDIETERWCPIDGWYAKESHMMHPYEFEQIEGERIKVLDNSNWTLGIVNCDNEGFTTVHYLNCNVHNRPIFPYFETTKERR